MKILSKQNISFLVLFFYHLSLISDQQFLGLDDVVPASKKSLRNAIASSVPHDNDTLKNGLKNIDQDLESKESHDLDDLDKHFSQKSAEQDKVDREKEAELIATLQEKNKASLIQDIDDTSQEIDNTSVVTSEQKEVPINVDDVLEEPILDEQVLHKEVQENIALLQQPSGFVDDYETVHFNFEDTDLSQVASYMERIHNIKFLTDDIISAAKEAKGLAGHKITFRTNKVFTKKQSWDLFLSFLYIAGLDVIPMSQAGFYKIVPFAKMQGESVPSYIGFDYHVLPDNDMLVRYVYFVKNIDPAKIQNMLTKMQAGSAKLDVFSELKALIFTDRASNIKTLMDIVSELDKLVMPQALSVVKLQRVNVDDVINLYQSLTKPNTTASAGSQTTQPQQRAWVPAKKESSLEYFPQGVITVGDKRTNSLILLGEAAAIKRVEEFILKYIDVPSGKETPPVFTYQLQYTNAGDIAPLLTNIVKYGASTPAGQYAGVRDGIKYFQKMNISAEPHSNSLIINATQEDFETLKPLIDELDVPQKQIGLEVLIVQVSDIENKLLGAQLSGPNGPNAVATDATKKGQAFLPNVSAQTSGIPSLTVTSSGENQASNIVVTNTGGGTQTDFSIKSSLASLLTGNIVNEAGSTLLTFGQPIWSVFKILKSITSVHLLANPFLVVSNNTQGQVVVGEERRIVSAEIYGTNRAQGYTKEQATLGLKITPQINKDNIVNLVISVENSRFLDPGSVSPNSALADRKTVSTSASVANGEVLVLGGLMTESYGSSKAAVPFLEHLPIFGWFFKSKVKTISRDHFLVFISPKLIETPYDKLPMDDYTYYKMGEAQKSLDMIESADWFVKNDPIENSFFGPHSPKTLTKLIGQNREGDRYLYDKDKKTYIENKVVTKKSKASLNKKSVDNQSKKKKPKTVEPKNSFKQRHKKIAQPKPAPVKQSGVSFEKEFEDIKPLSGTKNSIMSSTKSAVGDMHA